jgi:hypothetical protein
MLMAMLDNQKAKIVVPSVAVAEVLAGVEPAKHGPILAEFTSQFFCPAFDFTACSLAAKLWQYERGLPGTKGGLPEGERNDRRLVKADMLILATAKIAGASIFYSHDSGTRRLAQEAGMEGKDLPQTSGDWIVDLEAKEEV